MSYQQPGPQDAVPPQYQQYQPQQQYPNQQAYPQQGTYPSQGYPQQQPYPAQPQYYAQPGYGYPQPPVQVNVVQNAGGPLVMRKRVNHGLHFVLTLLTGGLWLFVWIPLCLKRKKVVLYR